MAALIRYVLLAASAAFLAMLFEPFFSSLLFEIGIDTSKWVGPMLTYVGTLFRLELLGIGVIGAAVGAWLHSIATQLDHHRETAPPTRAKQVSSSDAELFSQQGPMANEMPVNRHPGRVVSDSSEDGDPPPVKKSELDWNFESNMQIHFIGLSQQEGKLVVHQFQCQGKNLTDDPIDNFDGYVRSDRTSQRYPILINPGDGRLVRPDELNPVPVGAIISIICYFSEDRKPISMEKFLSEIVPFTFIFRYHDKEYRRQFIYDEIQPNIIRYEEQMRKIHLAPPKITRRMDGT